MEKKNTILLTVIAVATLLVAVVGATFAYFTATSTAGDPNDTASTGTTTTVGGVNIAMTSATTDKDIAYPGGYVVAGVEVTATNSDTTNSYDTSYNVVGTITNNTYTQLKWYLYEVGKSIADPIVADSCERQESAQADGTTRYWYTNCQLDSSIATTSSAIANGTVAAATGSEEESNFAAGTASVTTTTKEELTVAASDETTTYYYLVVEYPNKSEASQDTDQGQSIVAQLTNVTEPSSVVTQ